MPVPERLPGMPDWLPPESEKMAAVARMFCEHVGAAGYQLVLSPILEPLELFSRGVGELTDVAKEMYVFKDRSGRDVVLKPEATASLMRAFLSSRPRTPFRAYYLTPAFRYERAQRGRYRQHHQLGIELLGADGPDADAEVISLGWGFLSTAQITGLKLLINSLGDENCRPEYLRELAKYLSDRRERLCESHRDTALRNPLRVLDCKRQPCREVAAKAPRISDFLCEACASHHERLVGMLRSLSVPFEEDPHLVRGFDYYSRTVFEFRAQGLGPTQNAVGGGGRYDSLGSLLGAEPIAGVGFGIGLERAALVSAIDAAKRPDLYVIDLTGTGWGLVAASVARREGLLAVVGLSGSSLKAEMRRANAMGARYVLIRGEREQAARGFILKNLADGTEKLLKEEDLKDIARLSR